MFRGEIPPGNKIIMTIIKKQQKKHMFRGWNFSPRDRKPPNFSTRGFFQRVADYEG